MTTELLMYQDFSDWSQCQVMELVSHYVPSSENEVYDFLNALEDRMSHANSAVALSTIKTFLYLTLDMTATHQQVLKVYGCDVSLQLCMI
jgi:vesicle coat complex subunit